MSWKCTHTLHTLQGKQREKRERGLRNGRAPSLSNSAYVSWPTFEATFPSSVAWVLLPIYPILRLRQNFPVAPTPSPSLSLCFPCKVCRVWVHFQDIFSHHFYSGNKENSYPSVINSFRHKRRLSKHSGIPLEMLMLYEVLL